MFTDLVVPGRWPVGIEDGLARSLTELLPGEWAKLAAGCGLYASEPYLLAVERACRTASYYILLRDGEGRLGAGLPCYLWSGEPDPGLDHYEPFQMGGRWALSRRAREHLWRPTLLVGSRSGYRSSFVIAPWLEEQRQAVAWALAQKVAELAERLGAASVGWMWLEPQTASDLAVNLNNPEDLVLAGPNCSIPIPQSSFASYLQQLSSSRRKSARREMERFSASGLTVERCPLSHCLEELAPLAVNLQRRYGHRTSPGDLLRELSAQAERLDDQSLVLVCRRDGTALAFTLLYRWEDTLYGRMAGFEYDRLRGSCAYFNLAFYEPIRAAVEMGVDRYHLGMAAWQTKVLRGAELEPAWIAVWAPGRVRGAWRRMARSRWGHDEDAGFWSEQFPGMVKPGEDWRWTVAGLRDHASAGLPV